MVLKGSGGGDTGGNAADTLYSTDAFEFVLGLSEGQIYGLDGYTLEDKLKNLYIDDTPILNQQNVSNFKDSDLIIRYESGIEYTAEDPADATTGQTPIRYLFGGSVAQVTVNGGSLHQNTTLTRTMPTVTGGYDNIEVHINVQQLMKISDTGTDIATAKLTVEYKKSTDTTWTGLYYSSFLPASVFFGRAEEVAATRDPASVDGSKVLITGKTTGGFSITLPIVLPERASSSDIYEVRVTKTSDDSSEALSSEIMWTSCELQTKSSDAYSPNGVPFTDPNLEYHAGTAMLHMVGVLGEEINRLPTITGVWKGLLCRIPTNYDAVTKTYNETTSWDGNFKAYKEWTDNPFWIVNELILNTRMGMAKANPRVSVNRYQIYELAKYADGYNLTTGLKDLTDAITGETQVARYTFNGVLAQPRSGLDTINYILGSAFAKAFDSASGEIFIVGDIPQTPVATITPEMCLGSEISPFVYNFTPLTARHNEISATYIDPKLNWSSQTLGNLRDDADILKNGVNTYEYQAYGCIHAGEVWRKMHFYLTTVQTEVSTVSFTLPLSGIQFDAFDVINVCDPELGNALTGRAINLDAVANTVTVRDPMYFASAGVYNIEIVGISTNFLFTTVIAANQVNTPITFFQLQEDLVSTSVYPEYAAVIVKDKSVQSVGLPKPYRIVGITETSDGFYQIDATEVNPNKYSAADAATTAKSPNFSYIAQNKGQVVNNLRVITQDRVQTLDGQRVNLWVGWDIPANQPFGTSYEVRVSQRTIKSTQWTDVTTQNIIEIPNISFGKIVVTVKTVVGGKHVASANLEWDLTPVTNLDLQVSNPTLAVTGTYRNHRLTLDSMLMYDFNDPTTAPVDITKSGDIRGVVYTLFDNTNVATPTVLTTKTSTTSGLVIDSGELQNLVGAWAGFPANILVKAQAQAFDNSLYPATPVALTLTSDLTGKTPNPPSLLAYDNNTSVLSWVHSNLEAVGRFSVTVLDNSDNSVVFQSNVNDTAVKIDLTVGFYTAKVKAISTDSAGAYSSPEVLLSITDTLPVADTSGLHQTADRVTYIPFANLSKANHSNWHFWYVLDVDTNPPVGTPPVGAINYQSPIGRSFDLKLTDPSKQYVHLWFTAKKLTAGDLLGNGEPNPAKLSNWNYILLTSTWAGMTEAELNSALATKINEASANQLRYRGNFANHAAVPTPLFGDVYHNTTDQNTYAYNGNVWNLFVPKGTDGVGNDGKSAYLHIAYADNATGTVGFNQTNGKYIGTYTDSIATDSIDPTKYNWKLFQGTDGETGARSSGSFYGQVLVSYWRDSDALATIQSELGAGAQPVMGDRVTLSNASEQLNSSALYRYHLGFTETRIWNNFTWKNFKKLRPWDGIINPPKALQDITKYDDGRPFENNRASQGIELVANGTAEQGDNYNFSSLTFVNADSYSGNGSCFETSVTSQAVFSDILIPVDTTETYRVSVAAKALVGSPRIYAGVACCDIDGNVIADIHSNYTVGSLTTLATDLNDGDTVVNLTSAAGFNKATTHGYQNRLIFWDYTNSKGYTYPPESYSRNLSVKSLWVDAASFVGNSITLSAPWSGGFKAAGTSVSQANAGSSYTYAAAQNPLVPNSWTLYSGTVGGLNYSSGTPKDKFRQGTAFVKFLLLANFQTSGCTTQFDAFSIQKEVETPVGAQAKAAAAETAAKAAAAIDATNKVNSLEVGGRNLVLINQLTGTVATGVNSVSTARSSTVAANGNWRTVTHLTNTELGLYSISGYIKSSVATNVDIDFCDEPATTIAVDSTFKYFKIEGLNVSSQYLNHPNYYGFFDITSVAASTLTLSDLKIERGSKATAYSLSPEDQAQAVADAEAAAKQQEQDNRVELLPDVVEGRLRWKKGAISFDYDVFSPTERGKLDNLRLGKMPTDSAKLLNNWAHVTGTGKPADYANKFDLISDPTEGRFGYKSNDGTTVYYDVFSAGERTKLDNLRLGKHPLNTTKFLEDTDSAQAKANTAKTDAINTVVVDSRVANDQITATHIKSGAGWAVLPASGADVTSQNKSAGINSADTRNDNQPPSYYYDKGFGTYNEFKYRNIIGALGAAGYVTLKTVVPWNDISGGYIVQYAYSQEGTQKRHATSYTAWSAWAWSFDGDNKPSKADVGLPNVFDGANKFELVNDGTLGRVSFKLNGGVTQNYEAVSQAQIDGRVTSVRPDSVYKNSNTTPADIGYTGDLDATKGATWGSNLSGRPTELTDGRVANALGSNGRLNSQTNIPMVNSAGGMASLSTNPLTAIDGGTTATINIASHTVQFGFGTVTYSAGSITGLAFSTKYYVYCDDPNYSGGAVTYYATTTITAITANLGRRFISSIITPANGGGGTVPPAGECACLDMWVTDELQAQDVEVGTELDIWWSGDSYVKGRTTGVIRVDEPQMCVEIETESGAMVCVSTTTPVELKDHRILYAPDVLGCELAVIIDGVMLWEPVTRVDYIGEHPVMRISVGNGSYAAGVDRNKRVITHNLQNKP
jgi:predicted phage tail protein